MSELWYSLFTLVNPFSSSIFTLAIVMILNLLFGRLLKKTLLSQSELLVIYIMVTVASTISGATMMTSLIGTLAHPFWYASQRMNGNSCFGNIYHLGLLYRIQKSLKDIIPAEQRFTQLKISKHGQYLSLLGRASSL